MKLTILLPLYNGVEFLARSVGSVEGQTHRDWKLLIGVNGHAADSGVLHQARLLETGRIKVVHLGESPGKAMALNALAGMAQAETVALLDADDVWHPAKLERQLRWLREGYDVVGTLGEYIGDGRGPVPIRSGPIEFQQLLQTNHVINSSSLLRRSDARWDPAWEGIEDYDLWLRLAHAGRRFYNVPEVLVWHRLHAASAFNTKPRDIGPLQRRWRLVPRVVQSDRPRILIGILHTPQHAARRENCLRTWLVHAERCGIDYAFLVGGAAGFRRDGHTLHLPCPDDYPSLPQKTRRFCQWALGNVAFDYLFKCDDDTYVDLPKLAAYPAGKSLDYAGGPYCDYASGGGGYFLSRRAAEIVRDHLHAATGSEDLLVGRLLRRHGIPLDADEAFQGFSRLSGKLPEPDNATITAHGIHLETWQAIHRRLTDPGPLRIWMPTADRYAHVASICCRLLDKHWPGHPPVDVTHGESRPEVPEGGAGRFRPIDLGPDQARSWVERAIVYLSEHNADDLVLLVLDDYALFQPADARAVALACRAMRDDPAIASFALTWQPPGPAGLWRGRPEIAVFPHWAYAVNLQAGIWRRETLLGLLRRLPPRVGIWQLEQAASDVFREHMPGRIMTGWNIPRPADAGPFVDGTTKTGWVLAYHNLMHQGAPDPRHREFLVNGGRGRGEGVQSTEYPVRSTEYGERRMG